MKKLLGSTLALVILLAGSAAAQSRFVPDATFEEGPYFTTILREPTHPKMSASLLYTASFDFDGGMTDVALIYHKGSRKNTLLPDCLLDLGIKPISWTLLELGFGGNKEGAFGRVGPSINVGPTLLGPLTTTLERAGGKAATVGRLISSHDGSGVKLSLGWKANVIGSGGFVRFNEMRFPPRYGIGYTYQF